MYDDVDIDCVECGGKGYIFDAFEIARAIEAAARRTAIRMINLSAIDNMSEEAKLADATKVGVHVGLEKLKNE
jgi:hypothetical protein